MFFHLCLDFKERLNFTAGSRFSDISIDQHFHNSQIDFVRKECIPTGKILAFLSFLYSMTTYDVRSSSQEVMEKVFSPYILHSDSSATPRGQLRNFKKTNSSLQSSIFFI